MVPVTVSSHQMSQSATTPKMMRAVSEKLEVSGFGIHPAWCNQGSKNAV
jgi:hypothetical protein